MSASVESQKLSYARRLLKNELIQSGSSAKSFDESIDKCRKILNYCENYKHYHVGILKVIEDTEAHQQLLIQLRDEWAEFRGQEYKTRLAKAEWLRQSRI